MTPNRGPEPRDCPQNEISRVSYETAAYDIFIDLSKLELDCAGFQAHIDRLAYDAALADVAGKITFALPPGLVPTFESPGFQIDKATSLSATKSLSHALANAAASRRHLVVLLGQLTPGNEVLSLLIEAFGQDPLFGTIQPRFADDKTDMLWPLPRPENRISAISQTARAALPFLSAGVITPELPAACIAISWRVLVGSSPINQAYSGVEGALLNLLCEARRRGFRNFVANRAVIASSLNYSSLYPVMPPRDREQLYARYPEAAYAEEDVARLTQCRLEPLLTAAHSPLINGPSILLDCRGMAMGYNGTVRCILGLLEGFVALDDKWRIDVLVSQEAADFHNLALRFPRFHLYDRPAGEYAAAILMNQPWDLGTVAELHKHALVVVFNILDTIMWDIRATRCIRMEDLEKVWSFVAHYADGLLYISHFTRARFNVRFPVRPDVREQVIHLSFLPEDQTVPSAREEPIADHILVIGNDYEHKDMGPTLELLADAFPFRKIIALGTDRATAPNVVPMPSGSVEHPVVHQLIASARVIVFPSYYEGFGLPAVEGLAYGRPVVVRSSLLWTEISNWSRLPGQLIEFDDPISLIEMVGGILADLPVKGLASGTALSNGAEPAGWRDCARKAADLVKECLAEADGRHWHNREEALRLAGFKSFG